MKFQKRPLAHEMLSFLLICLAAACSASNEDPEPSTPTVRVIGPTSGPEAGGTSVTITGTQFVDGAALDVQFGGASATNVAVVDASTITCDTPAGSGTVDVVVTNGDGQRATLSSGFTYQPLTTATVSAITPTSGPEAGGTSVTITGTQFIDGAALAVQFGGASATNVTVVDASTITCDTPAGTGTVDVVVTNGDGWQEQLTAAYSYSLTPAIARLSAVGGPRWGGTRITIEGTGFVDGPTLAVQFGERTAEDVTYVDATRVTCSAPSGTGYVSVTMTSGDGQVAHAPGGFTYDPPRYLSTVRIGGAERDEPRAIVVNPRSGDRYLCGSFAGTVDFAEDFAASADTRVSAGGTDAFVTKINADGSYGWTRRIGGAEDDACYGVEVNEESGAVYLVGNFMATTDFAADFETTTDARSSAGQQDAFAMRIEADGSYGWTRIFRSDDYNNGYGIAVAPDGDAYVAGFYRGTMDFAEDFAAAADSRPSNGNFDIHVTKIRGDGSYGWTRSFGGTGDDRSRDIALSPDGTQVYLIADFENTVDFAESFAAAADSRSSQGVKDASITMIASDGTYGWTKVLGSSANVISQGIAVDRAKGAIYLTRCFAGSVDFAEDFAAGPDIKTNAGGTCDAYITKINADATYGWSRRIGGAGYDSGMNVTVDPISGDVYCAGWFDQSVDFTADFSGAPSYDRTSNGSFDGYITKLDANGSHQWTRVAGGVGQDAAVDLAWGGDGTLWLLGYFAQTVDFAADYPEASADERTSAGDRDIAVTALRGPLTQPQYGTTSTLGGSGMDEPKSITIDPASGARYICGSFEGTVDFAADFEAAADSKTSLGSSDAFITKINADGSYAWTRRLGGASSDVCFEVEVSPATGDVYLVGIFMATVDFAADFDASAQSRTSAGQQDVFVTRLRQDGSYGGTRVFRGTNYNNGYGIAVAPNGDAYLAGFYRGTMDFAGDFEGAVDSRPSNGDFDVHVTKILADGSYGWTRSFGGTGDDRARDIAVSPDGASVYVIADFEKTVNFAADFATAAADTRTSQGGKDASITMITRNGTYGWTKVLGGPNNVLSQGLALDPVSGAILVTRCFNGTVDFAGDFTAEPDVKTNAGGTCDAYITKINADASYGWSHRLGGGGYDSGMGSTVDPITGDVYITGWWEQTVDFSEDFTSISPDTRTALGSSDSFPTKLSADGTYRWTRVVGSAGQDTGVDTIVDEAGRLWLLGLFYQTADFAADFRRAPADSRSSAGDRDIFLMQLDVR
jgi:hypothetical protein